MTNTVTIDTALVRKLIASQFPQWAHLPVAPVASGGWDNRTFHLGDSMTVRLPSAAAYLQQVEKEQRWLPVLAPHLPLTIPAPLAKGEPAEGYPWPWSVYEWIKGEQATLDRISDLTEFATTLAEFLVALQAIDATGGPAPGTHNFQRGGPPVFYDAETREAIARLGDRIDGGGATEVWEAALAATWAGAPVWFHGDVAFGNLLVRDGRLRAVIDFGTSGVGDPSCDLAIAWTLFEGESREAFRAALPLDEGTWERGRGWTIWKALIVAANPDPAGHHPPAESLRVIDEVLADHRQAR